MKRNYNNPPKTKKPHAAKEMPESSAQQSLNLNRNVGGHRDTGAPPDGVPRGKGNEVSSSVIPHPHFSPPQIPNIVGGPASNSSQKQDAMLIDDRGATKNQQEQPDSTLTPSPNQAYAWKQKKQEGSKTWLFVSVP